MSMVKSMRTSNGDTAKNQYIITIGNKVYFQSYNTLIACKHKGKLTVSPSWDYSQTTMRYFKQFTGLNAAQTRRGIASGEIEVKELS